MDFQGLEFLQHLPEELYNASSSLAWGSSGHREPHWHFCTSDTLPLSRGPSHHEARLCLVVALTVLCKAFAHLQSCILSLFTIPSKLLNVLQDTTWRALLWVLLNSPDTIHWPSPSPSIALDQISVLVLFVCVCSQNSVDAWILGIVWILFLLISHPQQELTKSVFIKIRNWVFTLSCLMINGLCYIQTCHLFSLSISFFNYKNSI